MYIEWRPNGQAYKLSFTHHKCSYYAEWKKRGKPYLDDEYGSAEHCPECGQYGGHGTVSRQVWTRAPEYDAPMPGSLE